MPDKDYASRVLTLENSPTVGLEYQSCSDFEWSKAVQLVNDSVFKGLELFGHHFVYDVLVLFWNGLFKDIAIVLTSPKPNHSNTYV